MDDDLVAGRYRLVEKLGAGGMSEVWAADDTELDRRVALKLLAPQADSERFRREARAVAALGHPNINQVYDYGETGGRPYMVLECLTGGSLDKRLANGDPLPDAETRDIAEDIAAGLAHAHARGLVHRDLKPANVLFDAEGRAKIADFGIARLAEAGTLTETGTVLGTATTIAPEQAAGEPAHPASDVYSFGVLLFWMLTGRPPFLSDRPMELVQLHRDATPPAPSAIRADVPADLGALASAALAKDPAARPADGGELLRRLDRGPATATMPLEPARRSAARRRRPPRGALVALAAVVLATAGAAVAYAIVHGGGSASNAPTTVRTARLKLPKVSTAAATTAPAPAEPSATTAATTTAARPTTTRARATQPLPTLPATTLTQPLDTATYDLTTTSDTTTIGLTTPGG